MKAYNCICENCGESGDRIVKGNEVLKCCKCESVIVKVGGPIGGSDILPVFIGEANKFVPFKSVTLNRDIKNESEMQKAYEEMYGIKPVVVNVPVEEAPEKKGRGRPRKVQVVENTVEDDDDEKDDD